MLGATRARIALVYAIEYGVLGAATGVIALVAGTLAAWAAAFFILDVPLTFDARAVLVTVAGGGGGNPAVRPAGGAGGAAEPAGAAAQERLRQLLILHKFRFQWP